MTSFETFTFKSEGAAINHAATLGFVAAIDTPEKFMKIERESTVQYLHLACVVSGFQDDEWFLVIETRKFKLEI